MIVNVKLLSCVRLFATPWTVAHQAPPSMGFSTEEYWSGLPFPSPGDLPNPGIKAGSPTLQPDALTSEPPPSLLCPPPLPSQKKKHKKLPLLGRWIPKPGFGDFSETRNVISVSVCLICLASRWTDSHLKCDLRWPMSGHILPGWRVSSSPEVSHRFYSRRTLL